MDFDGTNNNISRSYMTVQPPNESISFTDNQVIMETSSSTHGITVKSLEVFNTQKVFVN